MSETATEAPKLFECRKWPNLPSPEWEAMEAKRRLCRWLMGGTDVVTSPGVAAVMLPQLPSEDDEDYRFRREHLTVVDPFFPDAVDDAVATVFPEPVKLGDDVPEELAEWWKNVDRGNRHGDAFLASVLELALSEGLPLVLLDRTRLPRDQNGEPVKPATKAEEELLGPGRVYWKTVLPENAINLPVDEDGALIEAYIRETTTRRVGEREEAKVVGRIRRLRRGNPSVPRGTPGRYSTWETYVLNGDGDAWVLDDSGEIQPPANLSDDLDRLFCEVQVYPFYGNYQRPYVDRPLFEHLAHLVRLYVLKDSDKNNIEHVANVPRRYVEGMTWEQYMKAQGSGRDQAKVSNVVFLNAGAKTGWFEHNGTAIAALAESQKNLEERIRRAATDPMIRNAEASELATVRMADEKKRVRKYQIVATMGADSFGQLLKVTAAWLGFENFGEWTWPDADPTALFRDDGDYLKGAFAAGGMDVQSFIEEGQRIGRFSPSLDAQTVRERVHEDKASGTLF